MKRILLFAAAVLTLFGCQEKGPVATDLVKISSESKTVGANGGSFSIMVASHADWTLASAESYNWVTPSATSGKDGDIVKFDVSPNTTGGDLEAKYVFTQGTSNAELVVKSLSKASVSLDVDIKEAVVDYNSGEISLIVSTEAGYRDINQSIASDEQWLKHVVTLPGEKANTAKMVFSYPALAGLDDRNAVITVSTEGAADVEVKVLQEAKHVLYSDKLFYTLAVEGETAVIPVISNVAYKIEIEQEGNWLSAGTKTAQGVPFTAKAMTSGTKRSANVKFTQTDAKAGETPLTLTITITQVNALISWAADMTGNRLFPKWDGTAAKLGNAKAVTLEALVNVNEFHKEISTLMGIEGHFLLRFGDAGLDPNRLQVATFNGNYAVDYEFETNRWYHIACTYEINDSNYATVKIYVDGELKGEKANWQMRVWVGWPTYGYVTGVNFSPDWSYEPSGNRCFWFGYSYDQNRDLRGLITEIRIWNRVLSEEEINATDHFYTVEPDAEGLYSYWKFTKGEGETIEDATGNGNKLYGETDIRKQGSDNKGDAGIKWTEVALPDK